MVSRSSSARARSATAKRLNFSSLEALESRIAPAAFFVGSGIGMDALKVFKGADLAGTSMAEMDAKTATEATAAVLLGLGDSLIYDADNSHSLTTGDTLLLKVTGGKAMVFLTDIAAGATPGGFDLNEITGLAVSDKFKAEMTADMNGTVITALDAAGNFKQNPNNGAIALQHSSIAQFSTTGQIVGSVFAGGSISKLSAGAALVNTGTMAISIDGAIATGTAAAGRSISLNGGGKSLAVEFMSNPGEKGGSITGVTLAKGVREISAGDGGDSTTGAGGVGGSIGKVSVLESPVKIDVSAGDGGTGFAKGGAGGSTTDVSLHTTQGTDGWTITSGLGGDALKFKGAAGTGGALTNVTLEVAAVNGAISINSGSGGNSPSGKAGNSPSGKAGNSGAVKGVTLINHGLVGAPVNIFSGDGGDLQTADGRGFRAADSGAVSQVTVSNLGGLTGFDIHSGAGGGINGGQGTAGNSGAVTGITIHEQAADSGTHLIHSGTGGALSAALPNIPIPIGPQATSFGNGGSSGNVSKITIEDTVGATNAFEVYAGVPVNQFAGGNKGMGTFYSMSGAGAGAKGGSIGSVSDVILAAPTSKVIVGKADAAGSAGSTVDAVAGNGGAVTKISGSVGTLDILAPSGGIGGEGRGGTGGSISKVDISAVTNFVHLIAAGNGGTGGKASGAGGSVADVKVAGNIGNFSANFGLTTDSMTMGGLVAGQGGLGAANGSITNVSATKIAAILAGRPLANAVGYGNAVTKLSKISASAIGADVNNSTTFDYTEGSGTTGYQPDNNGTSTDGDTALDGLVLVKKNGGGSTLPVVPLKLIEIP